MAWVVWRGSSHRWVLQQTTLGWLPHHRGEGALLMKIVKDLFRLYLICLEGILLSLALSPWSLISYRALQNGKYRQRQKKKHPTPGTGPSWSSLRPRPPTPKWSFELFEKSIGCPFAISIKVEEGKTLVQWSFFLLFFFVQPTNFNWQATEMKWST